MYIRLCLCFIIYTLLLSYLYLDALAFHLLFIKTSKLPQTADKKNEACVVKPCIKSCL